jgi:peptide/nickel transport system ATP-binding protein
MSILLITHDLGVVSRMADTVAVMYAGELVEIADKKDFFSNPLHPYSGKLFESVPSRRKRQSTLNVISGNVPSLAQKFKGCRFVNRCDLAFDLCEKDSPNLVSAKDGHQVRCHLYSQRAYRDNTAVSIPSTPLMPSRDQGQDTVIEAEGLKIYFPIYKGLFRRVDGYVKAVDDVSFRIFSGKTLALVGESGCGKTTAGKGILQLVPNTAGKICFNGEEISGSSQSELRPKRAGFQIVFQDPYSSLNPKMRVFEIIEEGMISLNPSEDKPSREAKIDELLSQVGLAQDVKHRYPHEFSGGQRQRIAISRALAVRPKLIVCDEPTSALDVSVQAQILNLLKQLQSNLGLAYLFITHNISVVEYLADEVAIMYLGKIVEYGKADEVLEQPRHPYTQALLSAVPQFDEASQREMIVLRGDLPSPVNPPTGCYFHPRCPKAIESCRVNYPDQTKLSPSHSVNCHLYS